MTNFLPRRSVSIHLGLAVALGFAMLAGGCGSDHPKTVAIHGALTLPSDAAPLVSDASARVSLIQQSSDATHEQIVAERTLHELGEPPVRFSMRVEQALLDRSATYRLNAQILDAQGDVIWQTRQGHPIDVFDNDNRARLLLVHRQTSPDGPPVTVRCGDDFTFELAHDKQGAMVHLGQRLISLHAAKSLRADSVRYIDDHQDEIVIGDGVISIYFDGVSHHGCKATSADLSSEG